MQAHFTDRLYIIERSGKLGLGTAYLKGFDWGLEKGYQYLYEMDCDFSHNPEDLHRIRQGLINGSDVVVGSRYIKGGDVKNWDMKRILLSKGASLYTRIITWMPVNDTTAGFVGYRRAFLEKLDFSKIVFKGYAFQIQMKYAAYKLGFKIMEIPITFKDRELGTSKISSNIIKEAIFGLQFKVDNSVESFTTHIRYKPQDSVWMSFTGLLGIEGARLLIDKDSVYVHNKLEKTYFATPIQEKNEWVPFGFSLEDWDILLTNHALDILDSQKKPS
ncbi:putative oolyprenol monophosphomannose synthase, partial [Hamiltosporidium magnivora]